MTAKIWRATVSIEATTKRAAIAALAEATKGPRVAGVRITATGPHGGRRYRKREKV